MERTGQSLEHPIAGRWTKSPDTEIEIRPLAAVLDLAEKDTGGEGKGGTTPAGFAISYAQMANVQLVDKKHISFDALARFQKKKGLLKRKKATYIYAPTLYFSVDDEAEAAELYEMLVRMAKAEPQDYTE